MLTEEQQEKVDGILELTRARYRTPDDAGVPYDSAEGGYQYIGVSPTSADDVVEALSPESLEDDELRAALVSELESESMVWIARED